MVYGSMWSGEVEIRVSCYDSRHLRPIRRESAKAAIAIQRPNRSSRGGACAEAPIRWQIGWRLGLARLGWQLHSTRWALPQSTQIKRIVRHHLRLPQSLVMLLVHLVLLLVRLLLLKRLLLMVRLTRLKVSPLLHWAARARILGSTSRKLPEEGPARDRRRRARGRLAEEHSMSCSGVVSLVVARPDAGQDSALTEGDGVRRVCGSHVHHLDADLIVPFAVTCAVCLVRRDRPLRCAAFLSTKSRLCFGLRRPSSIFACVAYSCV